MSTQIVGTDNSGGAKVELTFDYDEEIDMLTVQMRDYNSGEEKSIELLIENKDEFDIFVDQLRGEWP